MTATHDPTAGGITLGYVTTTVAGVYMGLDGGLYDWCVLAATPDNDGVSKAHADNLRHIDKKAAAVGGYAQLGLKLGQKYEQLSELNKRVRGGELL